MKFQKGLILIAFCFAGSLMAQQIDTLTIQGGSMAPGTTQEFPIYFRDVSGTLLDSNVNDFGGGGIELVFSSGSVTNASFRSAGMVASSINELFDEFNLQEHSVFWFYEFSETPFFTMDAVAPGDLIGYLSVTLANNATGTISLTAESNTFFQEVNGANYESVGAGNLVANFGSISTQAGSSAPQISSFTLSPTSVTLGSAATLSWQVSDATSISINQGIGAVAASGSTQVSPNTTTTYTLTATNETGTNTATATLTVTEPNAPDIQVFTASPQQIVLGGSSTISWAVSNASSISISPSIGAVSSSGSRTVSPAVTTNYVLTASNGIQIVTSEVTVAVSTGGSAALIRSFRATPNPVAAGQDFALQWDVENGTSWRIEDGGEHSYNLTDNSGSLVLNASELYVSGDTTFTLIVGNAAGDTSASTLLKVGKIATFSADKTELVRGDQVTLSWNVLNASSVSLSPAVGVVAAQQNLVVSPEETTTYLLSAQIGNFELTKEITVMVREAATLHFPLIRGDGVFQSDIHVVNLEDASLGFEWSLFGSDGSLLSGPNEGSLDAKATFDHSFTTFAGGKGWVEFRVKGLESAKLVGVANLRSQDGEELEAYTASTYKTSEILVPHIAADPNFYTEGTLVNLGNQTESASFLTGSLTFGLGSLAPDQQTHFDFRTLMGGSVQGNGWGRLVGESNESNVCAVEVFGRVSSLERQSVAVSLDDSAGTELYFAHLANPNNFWTGVVLINVNSQPATLQFKAYNDGGQLVAGRATETLAAGAKKTFLVYGSQLDFGQGAAWVKVESNLPLTGYQLFGAYGDRDVFAGFESVKAPEKKLCFTYLEDGRSSAAFTGIAVVNPNSTSNFVTFTLVDGSGAIKKQAQRSLNPNQKFIALVSELFSSSFATGDKVLAQALQPIVAFQIYGEGTKTLGGVLALPY